MDNIIAILVLAFFLFLGLKRLGRSLSSETNPLGIKGKLVWMDKGKQTKPFFNHEFKVLGKPDLMYQVDGGILAVEYKSRKGGYYMSDIVQAQAAALAARAEGYNVIRLLIKTAKKEKYINLPKNDGSLFFDIKHFVDIARKAKNGCAVTSQASPRKCKFCAYSQSCSHRK